MTHYLLVNTRFDCDRGQLGKRDGLRLVIYDGLVNGHLRSSWISQCTLWGLCVSVVDSFAGRKATTTERLHREKVPLGARVSNVLAPRRMPITAASLQPT